MSTCQREVGKEIVVLILRTKLGRSIELNIYNVIRFRLIFLNFRLIVNTTINDLLIVQLVKNS